MLNRASSVKSQAQMLTNIVLQNERSSFKRTRSPKDDDNPEERRPKKPLLKKKQTKKLKEKENSETLITTDNLAEVSTRKNRM